ncbi:nucleoside-diphosphate-sugar epimerase family protein [Colletotrichum sojae]|uniref:Nucleoside-diphosphate-sugar epimerase family protein n=1 Tax=Colletotrichum sojae TaxID=2175907 RepID=A0A8H6MN31_9PEZI|nr:nucleoside-diphosphate-sugar epimerase family protein [Colletotrichum sojae]
MSSTTPQKKAILVTGATGKQGGAVITALLEAGAEQTHTILAVTRNPASASAKSLEARGVKTVQGDLNDVPAIFSSAKAVLGPEADVWGVFSVQTAIGQGASAASEERQGKALIDASLASDVKHFVYSSIDRGGGVSYDNYVESVQNFKSKYNIEHHLVDSTRGGEMSWTILRPVAFMDNITPGMGAKVTATSWRIAVKDKPLQLVAASDVGRAAVRAFLESERFKGREVPLAGDEITLEEANAVFEEKTGGKIPETFQFFVRFLHWVIGDFGAMYRWFYTDGFKVDVEASKREFPGLLRFGEWVERESGFVKK